MAVWKLKDLDSSLVIDLKHGDILGRSEGTHKFPECSKMSRQHCQFIQENNFAYILDLNSRNGTFVNSVKTDANTKVLLGNGHILMFGDKTFLVKGGDEATAANKSMIPGINLEVQKVHSAQVQQQVATPVRTYNFAYKGAIGEFIVLFLKNLILTVLTLGIYLPYARTNLRKFIWKSTTLNNSPFLYKANPASLLKSYFILLIAFIAFSALSHAITTFVVKGNVMLAGIVGLFNYVVLTLFFLKIAYSAYAFMVNHTSYRSVKFQVKRSGAKDHFLSSVGGTLLTYLTLGIYYPFMQIGLEKIKWQNTFYGNIPFKFKPVSKDYAMQWFKGFFLSVFTLGLYTPWFLVNNHKYKIKHLSVGGAKFKTTATGMAYCGVLTRSFLLVLVTLGLAAPFVFNLHLTFFMNNLSLTGAVDFDQVLQAQKEESSDFADAAADVFDMDVELG